MLAYCWLSKEVTCSEEKNHCRIKTTYLDFNYFTFTSILTLLLYNWKDFEEKNIATPHDWPGYHDLQPTVKFHVIKLKKW